RPSAPTSSPASRSSLLRSFMNWMWALNSSGFHWLIWYSPVPRGAFIISMNFIFVAPCACLSRAPECGLQPSEIELLHPHHRLHRAACLVSVVVREHGAGLLRTDLPRHAEAIDEPAALHLSAAVLGQRGPEPIQLRLRAHLHHEREALPERERGTAVQRDVR